MSEQRQVVEAFIRDAGKSVTELCIRHVSAEMQQLRNEVNDQLTEMMSQIRKYEARLQKGQEAGVEKLKSALITETLDPIVQ
jgi:hypothetical protein